MIACRRVLLKLELKLRLLFVQEMYVCMRKAKLHTIFGCTGEAASDLLLLKQMHVI